MRKYKRRYQSPCIVSFVTESLTTDAAVFQAVREYTYITCLRSNERFGPLGTHTKPVVSLLVAQANETCSCGLKHYRSQFEYI